MDLITYKEQTFSLDDKKYPGVQISIRGITEQQMLASNEIVQLLPQATNHGLYQHYLYVCQAGITDITGLRADGHPYKYQANQLDSRVIDTLGGTSFLRLVGGKIKEISELTPPEKN